MELRHLRYFVAVAREENVSRAALRLHVSQPALSRQIRDLEDELGFSLLTRSAKAVKLTEAGRLFFVEAQGVLRRVEEAVKTARGVASGQNEELPIAYAPMPTVQFLPATLRIFKKQRSGVRVRLFDLAPEEMLERLHSGKVRMAFSVRPMRSMLRGLRFEELSRDAMRLAVSPDHPLSRCKSISIRSLSKYPLSVYSRKEFPEYHAYLQGLFSSVGQGPTIGEEHEDGISLITSLETGSAVAVLPQSLEHSTGKRLRLIPIVPSPSPLVVGAIWDPAQLSETAAQLLDIARQFAKGTRERESRDRA